MARAAKKKAGKKVAVRKKAGRKSMTTPSSWAETLAQYATDDKARTATMEGNNISIRGGSFKFQGQNLGDELRVVVLDFTHTKAYFDAAFDEDNPASPACAALKYNGKDMAPFEECGSVQTETGECKGCWANEFGTANVGAGKACKDGRRLAVLDISGDLEEEDIAFLNVPPTSIKSFDGYITALSRIDKGRPCFSMVTQLDFDAEEDYPVLLFSAAGSVEEQLTGEQLNTLMAKREEATKALEQKPWDLSLYESPEERKPAARRGKKKAGKKKVSKKKAGRSKFSA